MEWWDEEQRLTEIQQRLAEEDPTLARLLATGRPCADSDVKVVLGSVLAAFSGGLLLLALGGQFASPVLLATGVLFVVVVPAVLIVWRFRWRRWH